VSLWYQAPQSTFEPRDSRSIGWSQVPNRRAVLLDDDKGSPQRSTGGGTQLDLSNTLSFGGPNTDIQLDPTINFAQFGFQNFQDLTAHQYQMISNMSFSESLNQIENIYNILDSANYEARIAALESWRGTAAGSGCDSERTYISGVSLTTGGLVFTRSKITFTEGLLSSCNTATDTTITTTECP